MYVSTFVSGLFNWKEPRDAQLSARAIGHQIHFLFQIDLDLWRVFKLPDLYSSGVRYKSLAPPCDSLPGDIWQDALTLLKTGKGDCKDLACYLAAQRVVKDGISCRPAMMPPKFYGQNEFALYHIVVLYDDGSFEDPSEKLGMPPLPRP